MRRVVITVALLAASSVANAVPLILVSHEATDGGGTSTSITDGSHPSGIAPPSTATWEWDGNTLTATGLYSRVISIPVGTILSDQVTDLSIDTGTGTATATSYSCIEGTFLSGVGFNGCGGYELGPNYLDESMTTWGPGLAISQTIGGDDVLTDGPRSISAYDFGNVSVTGTGMNPGDLVMIGNGTELGTPGAELMTFEVQPSVPVPLILISHEATGGGGSAETSITDGSHTSGIATPSTATWEWDGTTLTSTGLYSRIISLGGSPTLATVISDQVTDLSIYTGTGAATATSYSCIEGTFLSGVGFNGCGGYDLGPNYLDESTTTWGPGLAISQTIGGDDVLTDGPRSISAYDFGNVSVTGTGMNPGDLVMIGNGIPLGTPGAELLTFEVQSTQRIFGTFTGTVTSASDPGQASFGRDPADWIGRSVFGTFIFDLTTAGISDGDPDPNTWSYSDPSRATEWVSVTALIDGVNFTTAPPDAGAAIGDVVAIRDDPTAGDLLGPQDNYISAAGRSVIGFDLFGSDALLSFDGIDSMTLDYSGGGGAGIGIIEDLLTSAGRSGLINFALTNVTVIAPTAFTFSDYGDVPLSTLITSNTVTVTGIGPSTEISVSGGEYSVGCTNSFTSSPGVIDDGQTVCVRHLSSNLAGTTTDTVLFVGGISDTFTTATDTYIDTDADTLQFIAKTDVPLSTLITSNTVSVTGINIPSSISVSGGEYSIGCTESFTNVPGTIEAGDTICLRLLSSAVHDDYQSVSLSINGSYPDFFSVQTLSGDDYAPDTFTFIDKTSVSPGATITSDPVIINGINVPASISVAGGEYSVGCTAVFTSDSGTANNGDSVCVRHQNSGTTSTLLKIGGVVDVFTSSTTTDIADTQPDPLDDFGVVTGVSPYTYVESPTVVTINGINAPAPISITNGSYSVGCTGSWQSSTAFVNSGETVCVQQNTPAGIGTSKQTILTVGAPEVTSTFTTTTHDTVPDQFIFKDRIAVDSGTLVTSEPVTITGITEPAIISILAGEYSIGCTSTFTSLPGTLTNDQTVCVRHVNMGGSSTILNIGDVTDGFSSTIESVLDTRPDSLADLGFYSAGPGGVSFSNTIPITGINVPVRVSASSGYAAYAIGCLYYELRTEPGLIEPGQSVCIAHENPPCTCGIVSSTLTVGGLEGIFETDTGTLNEQYADTTPNFFSFKDESNVPLSSTSNSAPVVINGFEGPLNVTIANGNGEYSVGCTGSFTTGGTSGENYIENGQTVCVRHTTASTAITETHTVLKVGGVSDRFTSTTMLDSDGDGIPDAVELANGLNPQNSADALEDADDDLRSNLDEYLDGGQITVADTGDINGDQTIDITDFLLMQRHLVGPPILDTQAISRGDYDRDDTLDLYDLLSLQQTLTAQ